MKAIISSFLAKLQPGYPHKVSVSYERKGDPIPMPMDSGDPIILSYFQKPIELKARDDYD
jgi:hypothetical protein